MKTAAQIEAENGLPSGSIAIGYDADGQLSIYGLTIAGKKFAKLAELAAARYAEEIAGIDLGGARINTGRGDQAMTNGAWAFVTANPEATIRFKGADGWQDLSAAQIAGIATAVGQHVQACFAREGELADAVAAAETVEAVEAIEWVSPYAD